MSYLLVTTSCEESWSLNKKVLFLGEWCKRHGQKSQWFKLDFDTAEPYAITVEQKHRINCYADNLFKELLHELTNELNRLHGVNYSERYWNIVVGPWLYKYIKTIVNRYCTLEQALSNYDIDETIIIKSHNYSLSSLTYMGFIRCLGDDFWNHVLYANILQNWPESNINLIYREAKVPDFYRQKHSVGVKRIWNWKRVLKSLLFKVSKIFLNFARDSDAVIIKSYLPIFKELQLHIALGQFPQFWHTSKIAHIDEETGKRSGFFQNYERYHGIDREVRRLVSVLIPRCYLEGYQSSLKQVNNLSWPHKPKFIYTANSFSTDEIFKLWTAKKVENGAPYYVGQHGNNYGTLAGSEIWTEITTCDKFFSWGWGGVYGMCKAVPAFVFKTIGLARITPDDHSGGLLLVERGPGHRDGCQDRFYEHILYQKYVLNFFDGLDDLIKDKTTVRLHHSSQENNSSDMHIWKAHHPSIKIDPGFINIYKLIPKNRLVVHSYDSSGVLETLSLNIPTVCFWRGGLSDLLVDAVPYYQLLIDVGIVHITPEGAAKHVTDHWRDLDSWWHSTKVQQARKVFCDRYAKEDNTPILTLKKLLTADL